MKHTSQHCYDKTADGKMTLFRECCFPNPTNPEIMVNKIMFVGFKGAIATHLDGFKVRFIKPGL